MACRMVICDDQGGNCDIHSHTHTNRPHTSLEPREAKPPGVPIQFPSYRFIDIIPNIHQLK